MSVDVRTRIDGNEPAVDPADFFDAQLPAALDAARRPDWRPRSTTCTCGR